MTCNKLIKENKNFLINFEKFIKPKLQNPDEGDNYEYIDAFCHNLYSQINETIIKLDLKNCTIIESDYLKEQLKEMVRLYFIEIEVDKKFLYWSYTEELAQEHLEYQNSFINPEKFSFEYVIEIMNKLGIDTKSKEQQIKKSIENNTWFIIGVELANGNAFEIYEKYETIKVKDKRTVITKEIFKDRFLDAYKMYIFGSINNYKSIDKNLFRRPNAETEISKIVEHCKNKGIKICDAFIEKCKAYKISIN